MIYRNFYFVVLFILLISCNKREYITPAALYINVVPESMTQGNRLQYLVDLPGYANDLQKMGLRGPVYEVVNIDPKWQLYGVNTSMKFFPNGRLYMAQTNFLELETVFFEYDSFGRLINMKGTLIGNQYSRKMTYGDFEYDALNRLKSHTFVADNREDSYNADTYVRSFEYDVRGVIRRCYVNEWFMDEYKRNNMVRHIKVYDYECDERGRIIRMRHNFQNSPAIPDWLSNGVSTLTYYYDSQGMCIRADELFVPFVNSGTDSVTVVYNYEWNDHGDLVETYGNAKIYPSEKEQTYIATYKYVYDENGNWTQRSTYKDGSISVINRVINYYSK